MGIIALDYFWPDSRHYRQANHAGARWWWIFPDLYSGIVGAVVGGWLATMFGIGGSISGFNLHSFLVAVVGAIPGAGRIPPPAKRIRFS